MPPYLTFMMAKVQIKLLSYFFQVPMAELAFKMVSSTKDGRWLSQNSSPYYSCSNSKAEAAVKIAKTLLRKVNCSKLNFYKALLNWWNTSTEGVNASPSQQFFRNMRKQDFQQPKRCLLQIFHDTCLSRLCERDN